MKALLIETIRRRCITKIIAHTLIWKLDSLSSFQIMGHSGNWFPTQIVWIIKLVDSKFVLVHQRKKKEKTAAIFAKGFAEAQKSLRKGFLWWNTVRIFFWLLWVLTYAVLLISSTKIVFYTFLPTLFTSRLRNVVVHSRGEENALQCAVRFLTFRKKMFF